MYIFYKRGNKKEKEEDNTRSSNQGKGERWRGHTRGSSMIGSYSLRTLVQPSFSQADFYLQLAANPPAGACCTARHVAERASSQSLTFGLFGPYSPEQPRAPNDLFGPDVQLWVTPVPRPFNPNLWNTYLEKIRRNKQ